MTSFPPSNVDDLTPEQFELWKQERKSNFKNPAVCQTVYEYYASTDIPFKTKTDLEEYHEKCIRWDPEKWWPNISSLMYMSLKENGGGSKEATKFRKLVEKLNKRSDRTLTLNIVRSGDKNRSWFKLQTE